MLQRAFISKRSIDVGISTQILQDLLPLLFVSKKVHALLLVPAFNATLRFREQSYIAVRIAVAASPADGTQTLLLGGTEPLKKFVLERQHELGATCITLASGTTGQLPIDSKSIVALGAYDMEPACFGDTRAELNIRAAAGHVRGNGDASGLSGLGHDLGFLLVVTSVEDSMGNVRAIEHGA